MAWARAHKVSNIPYWQPIYLPYQSSIWSKGSLYSISIEETTKVIQNFTSVNGLLGLITTKFYRIICVLSPFSIILCNNNLCHYCGHIYLNVQYLGLHLNNNCMYRRMELLPGKSKLAAVRHKYITNFILDMIILVKKLQSPDWLFFIFHLLTYKNFTTLN